MTNRSPSPEMGVVRSPGIFFPWQAASNCGRVRGWSAASATPMSAYAAEECANQVSCSSNKRLAEPVVVEPREPLRLREEVVHSGVGFDRERLVVEGALESHAGELVFVLLPLVFVVLFKEGAVADEADFGLHGPVVQRPADKLLAMVPEYAAAEVFFRHDVAAVEAEVIEAVVVDAQTSARPVVGPASPKKLSRAYSTPVPKPKPRSVSRSRLRSHSTPGTDPS